jgi:hypothetical protein
MASRTSPHCSRNSAASLNQVRRIRLMITSGTVQSASSPYRVGERYRSWRSPNTSSRQAGGTKSATMASAENLPQRKCSGYKWNQKNQRLHLPTTQSANNFFEMSNEPSEPGVPAGGKSRFAVRVFIALSGERAAVMCPHCSADRSAPFSISVHSHNRAEESKARFCCAATAYP